MNFFLHYLCPVTDLDHKTFEEIASSVPCTNIICLHNCYLHMGNHSPILASI